MSLSAKAFYFLGRLTLGAVFGTATVWLVYRLGKREGSAIQGLAAAGFLAASWIHVELSHYIYADIPLTLALLAVLGCHLSVLKGPSVKRGLAAGVALGWAVSIKYTALYFLPAALLAYILAKRPAPGHGLRRGLLTEGAAALLTFALLAPYTFLDWGSFIQTIRHQSTAQGYVGLWHYLIYGLVPGTSVLFLSLSALGAARMWGDGRRPTAAVTLCFIGVYYLINTWAGQPFARYIVPIVPALCFLAGAGWDTLANRLFRTRWLRRAVVILLAADLLAPSVYADALFLKKDTLTLSREWIEAHLPEDTVIVLDSRFYGPPLPQTASLIHAKQEELALRARQEQFMAPDAVRSMRLSLMDRALRGQKRYQTYLLNWEGENGLQDFLMSKPVVRPDLRELDRIGADYLILSYSERLSDTGDIREALGGRLDPVASFSPYWQGHLRRSLDPHYSTAAPHLPLELYRRNRLGPYLEVYRIRR